MSTEAPIHSVDTAPAIEPVGSLPPDFFDRTSDSNQRFEPYERYMEDAVQDIQESEEGDISRGKELLMAVRRSRLGRAIAGTALGAAGLLSMGATKAEANLTPAEKQVCVDIAVSRPTIFRRFVMRHAGIRPFTPGHRWHVQGIDGNYGIPALPDGSKSGEPNCDPIHRLMTQRLQMQKPHHRRTLLTLDKFGPNYIPNIPGRSYIRGDYSWSPPHAWPKWVFNQCTDGKGWLKLRYTQTFAAKNIETGQIEAERTYRYPVPVKNSNCAAARQSERLTKNAKQEWNNH